MIKKEDTKDKMVHSMNMTQQQLSDATSPLVQKANQNILTS